MARDLNDLSPFGWVVVLSIFEGTGPFHLNCQILMLINVLPIRLSFGVCRVSSDGSFFNFDTNNLSLDSFLCQSCYQHVNFINIFKETRFCLSLLFYILFLLSMLLISTLYYFFILLGLGLFCYSFSTVNKKSLGSYVEGFFSLGYQWLTNFI